MAYQIYLTDIAFTVTGEAQPSEASVAKAEAVPAAVGAGQE